MSRPEDAAAQALRLAAHALQQISTQGTSSDDDDISDAGLALESASIDQTVSATHMQITSTETCDVSAPQHSFVEFYKRIVVTFCAGCTVTCNQSQARQQAVQQRRSGRFVTGFRL
jgi:hypothetical protein